MIGRMLNRYKVVDRLGKGGMGEVWVAEDTRLGRRVAIKMLPAEFAEDRQRLSLFEREARTVAALNHPLGPHLRAGDSARRGCRRND